MAIYADKLKKTEVSNPSTGDAGYNSRGQRVYYNGSKWSTQKPGGVTVTRTKTNNRAGTKTKIKYSNKGVSRTKTDKTGKVISEQTGLSMKEHKKLREADSQNEQLLALKEVGASGYWDDKGKLNIVDAQGQKYKVDSLWGGHTMNKSGTGGTQLGTWAELRRAAGLAPTISNPWYEGPNPPLGPPTEHVPPPGTQQPPTDPTQPPVPPQPPTPPITGPVDPPMPKPPQDPLPNPRPEPEPPEFPDTDQEYPFPVFSNQSRDPREFFEQWMNGELGTPDLLKGMGPQSVGGPPGQQQQPPPPPDEPQPNQPPADPADPNTQITDLFPDGFNFQTDFDQLVAWVGQERAMDMFRQWFQGAGGTGSGGGKTEFPNQPHVAG